MTEHRDDARMDHELAVEELTGTALRGRVALLTGSDEDVSPVLSDVAVDLVDSTEVARLDAMKGHTATAVVRALVVPLGIEPDGLVSALRARAETLPLVLVVENGECLGTKALSALRALMQKSDGGLGLVIGGDPETAELLEQAGIPVDCQCQAAGIAQVSDHAVEAEASASSADAWWAMVPWKHLAAVAGLLLLVLIFWPDEEPAESDKPRALALPAPAKGSDGKGRADPEEGGREVNAGDTMTRDPSTPPPPTPEPESKQLPEPKPESKGSPEPAPEKVESPAPEPVPDRPPETPPSSGDGVSVTQQPELTGLEAELGYRQEDWLLTLAENQWMLQLTLAADEDRARAVLDQLGRGEGAYYRGRRDDNVVYIVLAGPYGSREEALGARAGLPEPVRSAGPFPRPVSAIRQEIASDGDAS